MPKIKFSAPLASNRANGISKTENGERLWQNFSFPPPPVRPAPRFRSAAAQTGISFQTGYQSDLPRNRILFGAPGTGKSFTLNREKDTLLAAGGEYERVTFHPD